MAWIFFPRPVSPDRLLAEAKVALREKDYARARMLAKKILPEAREYAAGLVISGEAAIKAGDLADADDLFAAISPESEHYAVSIFTRGEIARDAGRFSDAIEFFQAALDREPGNLAAHERLAFLLKTTGDNWAAQPHYRALQQSTPGLNELIILGDLERAASGHFVTEQVKSDDVLVKAGLAATAKFRGDTERARELLAQVVREVPHLASAQARFGELILDEAATFQKWHAQLPASADSDPDIWFVRGLWARRQGELRIAAGLLLRVLRIQSCHRRATYQLGQVLTTLEHPAGSVFTERALLMFQLTQNLDLVFSSDGQNEVAVRKVTGLLEQLGRIEEAVTWANWAAAHYSSFWPGAVLDRLVNFRPEENLTVAKKNPIFKYSFADFPTHESLFRAGESRQNENSASELGQIRFAPADRGIDFVYLNADEPDVAGAKMFEQTGGGVAIIDFDNDGAPDIFFTQGARVWPANQNDPPELIPQKDRLFRNGRNRFRDVTQMALPDENGFGQGCTVVDFNNDGFQDLYVANIGRNVLLLNNGDGTFQKVALQESDSKWTASCAGVDLDQDGNPDLIDVNYLQGDDLFTRLCRQRGCSPANFDGEPDVILMNSGRGEFQKAEMQPDYSNSKGLGLVAFYTGVEEPPSIFVANDQVANFVYRFRSASEGFEILNDNFRTGLAMNDAGVAMACMGVAAGDPDQDGDIDLFVTNFSDESNTLYLQDAPGLFLDATESSGLVFGGVPYTGWGTQFLDADLDGYMDLVLTNGHFDRPLEEGDLYRMPPLCYQNRGDMRFQLIRPEDAGEYFEQEYLGRGLARLDWNLDGRPDFVVSNMNQPASLVENVSSNHGRFLNVRLHATETARDAIGARLTVQCNKREFHSQLLAGDGYMASNERTLMVGLGFCDSTSTTAVEIAWPSGSTTMLADVPVDSLVEITESCSATIWQDGLPRSCPVVHKTHADSTREE